MSALRKPREDWKMSKINCQRHSSCVTARRDYWLLYLLCLPLFLAAAIVSRVLPARWRPWPPSARTARSIFGEARAAADAYLPYAMMS